MKTPSKIQKGVFATTLIPTILLLTPAGSLLGMAIQGGQQPFEGMFLGLICGFAAMLWATAFTIIAWRHQKWFQIKIALIAFLLLDFWWVPIAIHQSLSDDHFSRTEISPP